MEGVAGHLAYVCVTESVGIPHEWFGGIRGGITTQVKFGLRRESNLLL